MAEIDHDTPVQMFSKLDYGTCHGGLLSLYEY